MERSFWSCLEYQSPSLQSESGDVWKRSWMQFKHPDLSWGQAWGCHLSWYNRGWWIDSTRCLWGTYERTWCRLWEDSTRLTSSLHWFCPLEAYLDRPTSRFWGHQHKEKNDLRWHPLGHSDRPEREVVPARSLARHWSRQEREMQRLIYLLTEGSVSQKGVDPLQKLTTNAVSL